jgi:acyl-CoA thioesterase-1
VRYGARVLRNLCLAMLYWLAAATLAAPAAGESSARRPEAATAPTILCLGDSLTEGLGVAPEEAFPAVLERLLHKLGHRELRVVNAGISGSTSASAVSRLRWQLRARPAVVVLALGANDGLRGQDPAAMRRELGLAIDLAQQSGARVLLAGMQLPTNLGADYRERFARVFPELAVEKRVALIPFLLDGVAARPDLNQPDGIHPNAKGHERVAENVLSQLLPMLESL